MLFNTSLSTGRFTTTWKHTIVTPLLKKAGLDESVPTNYRPVSNLPFLSKVLERIVHHQLTGHLITKNLLPDFQSAYRNGHSTETAELKVFSDVVDGIEKGQFALLSLLDLTAAFDTVDHEILFRRMSLTFGITGISLRWFESYLHDRNQSVQLNDDLTRPRHVLWCPTRIGSDTDSVHVLHSRFGENNKINRSASAPSLLCRRHSGLWFLSI